MQKMGLFSSLALAICPLAVPSKAAFEDNSLSGSPDDKVCRKSQLREADGSQQGDQGTCSDTQLGEIPSSDKMTSTIIQKPKTGETLKAEESFEVVIRLVGLETGFFSDPDREYYAFSQQLNEQGIIKGHSHIVIQKLRSSNTTPDATDFELFQGLNQPDEGDGRSFLTVDGGLSSGRYRLCTLASSFSHNNLIMPVAQRGPKMIAFGFLLRSSNTF